MVLGLINLQLEYRSSITLTLFDAQVAVIDLGSGLRLKKR